MPEHFDAKPVQVDRRSNGEYAVGVRDEETGEVTWSEETYKTQEEAAASVGGHVHAPVPASTEGAPPIENPEEGEPIQPATQNPEAIEALGAPPQHEGSGSSSKTKDKE